MRTLRPTRKDLTAKPCSTVVALSKTTASRQRQRKTRGYPPDPKCSPRLRCELGEQPKATKRQTRRSRSRATAAPRDHEIQIEDAEEKMKRIIASEESRAGFRWRHAI